MRNPAANTLRRPSWGRRTRNPLDDRTLAGWIASTATAIAVVTTALALAGCATTVDATLIKEAGVHGDRLEIVYDLYNEDVMKDVSKRDLKGVNEALKAGDLKKATPGDVRRAQSEIRSRIKRLEKFVREIKRANAKLKDTARPNFTDRLEDDFANGEFAKAYTETTKTVERYVDRDLDSIDIVFDSLEKYLDFLEQWEEFLNDGDTSGLVAAGEASDKAVARLNRMTKRIDDRGALSKKIKPLVDRMASAASDSSQLNTLVDELKKDYPKSFLSVHMVEKTED